MPRNWEHPYYISALRTPGSGFRNSETSQQTTGFGIARVDAECKTLCIASLCFFFAQIAISTQHIRDAKLLCSWLYNQVWGIKEVVPHPNWNEGCKATKRVAP